MSSINIKFPFKDSVKGFFLDMDTDDISAIKSDLMHLLTTNKGERYYQPEFGTNIRQYLFSPNDSITHNEMKEEVSNAVKQFIPNLSITNLTVKKKDNSDYFAEIKAEFLIQDGVFEKRDFIIINF